MAVTASGPAYNFDREQEVTSSGLIVLQEFLKQLTEAFERHVARVESSAHTEYILLKLRQYERDLGFLNKYKQRWEFVSFASKMALKNEDCYGAEVAEKARAFLELWESFAGPVLQAPPAPPAPPAPALQVVEPLA